MLRGGVVSGSFGQDVAARELASLFAEELSGAVARERSEFDRLTASVDKLVLFGAGNLGRETLACLRNDGVPPVAFSDNRSETWGRTIDGIDVLAPADAARLVGSKGAVLVTIWNDRHRFAETAQQLRALGCPNVFASPALRWKYQGRIPQFPFFFLDLPSRIYGAREEVLRAANVWADDESRREYVSQIRLRMLGDLETLPPPAPDQYAPTDLFEPNEDEVFVDCGAFDGDTIREFVAAWKGRFKAAYALEPDPATFTRLVQSIDQHPHSISSRITPVQGAVGARSESVSFRADGTMGAAIATDGDVTITCHALDDLFDRECVTYVKMDIEGFEPAALQGSLQLVKRCRPILAVCAYHAQDHVWSIPLFLHEQLPDYSLFLRPHKPDGWDLIVYAVPRERLLRA